MSKQDRQGVRTPADVERKYNLGKLAASRGATATLEIMLSQLSQTLAQYMAATNARLEKLSDGSVNPSKIDNTLKINEKGMLGVNVVKLVEEGSELAVTSGAVALSLAKIMLRLERLEGIVIVSDTSAILGRATLGKMILGREV